MKPTLGKIAGLKRHFLKTLTIGLGLILTGIADGQQPGTQLWQVPLPGQVSASPAITSDGSVYVLSSIAGGAGWLFSISPEGATNWVTLCGIAMRSSPTVAPDGTIYLGNSQGTLFALRPDGTHKWVVSSSGAETSSVALGSAGTLYFTMQLLNRTRLFSLNPDSTTNWMISFGPFASPGSVQLSSPVIGPDGRVYVSTLGSDGRSRLYAINPNGTTNWSFAFPMQSYCTPSVGPDGTLYVGGDDSRLYAFDTRGNVKWRFSAARYIESSPVLLDSQGLLFFGDGSAAYSVDTTGAPKWTASTGGVSGSPALLSDGTVLIGSFSTDSISALSPAGSNLWTFTGPGPIFASPVVSPQGTIYVGCGSNLFSLYGTNSLASSSWPMFRHDVKHTGRAIQRAIAPPLPLGDGSMALSLSTETGLTYQVQCSSDFVSWTELTNFVSTSISNQVIDLNAVNYRQRFYRLECQ